MKAKILSSQDIEKLTKALEDLNSAIAHVDELHYTCQRLIYGNRTRYNQKIRFRLINEALEKGYLS